MYTKIYWLYSPENKAKLGIMARPRGEDWLEDEIKMLANQNINILVSLLEFHEIKELGLKEEENICKLFKIKYINYPIIDRGIPPKDKTELLINQLTKYITQGQNIVIHCRMGIGRSSIIAALVLLKFGFKSEKVFNYISDIRGVRVPDTDEQIKWVHQK